MHLRSDHVLAQTEITAIVDAASFTPGISRRLVTVFGRGLSDRSVAASQIPLPTTLDGVALDLCNQESCTPADLIFVSPEQINFYSGAEQEPSGQIAVHRSDLK